MGYGVMFRPRGTPAHAPTMTRIGSITFAANGYRGDLGVCWEKVRPERNPSTRSRIAYMGDVIVSFAKEEGGLSLTILTFLCITTLRLGWQKGCPRFDAYILRP